MSDWLVRCLVCSGVYENLISYRVTALKIDGAIAYVRKKHGDNVDIIEVILLDYVGEL
jgi:hypothetical protein